MEHESKIFTNVNESSLVGYIQQARRKIIYVAPGVRKLVAQVLADRLVNSPDMDIAIILDVDAEVCRLGYGDVDGLETLKNACETRGSMLYHQPGIRIGLLIADDTTLVFAPTPLLIAEPSNQPNAIRLDTAAIPKIVAACNPDAEDHSPEIGLDPVKTPDIEAVKKDLELNPPQKFNVSRAVRVFNSVIQYVDVEFNGYKLSLRKVDVPPELLGLGDDPQMATRWRHTFQPFQQSEAFCVKYEWRDDNQCAREEFVTERTLEKDRHALKRRYIKDIPGHGTVIQRFEVDAFKKQIELLEKKTAKFKTFVESRIADVAKSSAKNLVADLWPRVKSRQLSLHGWHNATEDERRKILEDHIADIVSSAVESYNPTISCRYKAVAYESIQDPAFRNAVIHVYGDDAGRFFSEYDAAPATGLMQDKTT